LAGSCSASRTSSVASARPGYRSPPNGCRDRPRRSLQSRPRSQ
jgi:hypothetical protein